MDRKTDHSRESLVSVAVRRTLLAAAIAAGGSLPTAALAQEAPASNQTMEEVVVTGSILRRTDAETPSPVTVLSAETLEERGINTVSEAIQRLSANNAGTIQQGWNTGFNFASGANAPALRGLTVQSTLSVADGLRLAPYPYADDGQRNFVDLNAIPSAIVEKIEVLRDGASSTYGADAIAGVINIITKKEIQGLKFGASTAMSEGGGGDENHIDVTWGHGDLESEGYNFYVSGEYQKTDVLWARDRDYPFNTLDWSRKCGDSGACMANLTWNGLSQDGSFNGLANIPGISLVRHVTTGSNTGAGRYAYLNQQKLCGDYDTNTIDAATSPTSPLTICNVNQQADYTMLQPEIKRAGLSMRFTTNLGENTQLYAMGNFYKTDTFASLTPISFNGTPTPPNQMPLNGGGSAAIPAANVILPVYVCDAGVGTFNGLNTGCTAANGRLNPYNPFATNDPATAERAQLLLRNPNPRTVDTTSKALRGVVGLEGSFGDNWGYSANLTASQVQMDLVQNGYLIPQRIWDATARGTFNYNDVSANSAEVWDFVSPTNKTRSLSQLWQVQGTISKEIVDLPGGALQAAVGVAYREESIDQPSANPEDLSQPYSRYYSVNAVGTSGSRDVKSGFFEISAPVLKQLELAASGRYDEYSSGQSNFSPKLGFKFTPVDMIAIRGTWSQGFRIPSFNEAYGLPTTGYVTRSVNCSVYPQFCTDHGRPPNNYGASYSLGLTTTGNSQLDPEESTSFTAGIVFEPISNVSVTVDYWQIKVENLITGLTDTSAVEEQYYNNGGVVNIPGIIATPGTPDANNPNALPVLGFVETQFANQDKEELSGIDFAVNMNFPLGDAVTWRSSLDASWLRQFDLHTGGQVLEYAGTLSPCNITSCSGAPEWRGSWQNTFEFGPASVSVTAYYSGGYDTASLDYGGIPGDCEFNAENGVSTAVYTDGTPVNCTQPAQWNADLNAKYTFNDKYTVYADVLNFLDIKPEFDPSAAYALFGFNPAWGGPNIMGRYYRVGVKVDLN